jgi:hypothetical protein
MLIWGRGGLSTWQVQLVHVLNKLQAGRVLWALEEIPWQCTVCRQSMLNHSILTSLNN